MKRKSLFLSAVILLFGGLVLAACSKDDNNDNGGTPPETPTVNTTADVVILSYGIGGGDLDSDAECDFIKAAYMLQSYKNVRYFAQYKYSSEDGFAKTTAKNKEKDPSYNYQLSGDYGKVYRFELTPRFRRSPSPSAGRPGPEGRTRLRRRRSGRSAGAGSPR